MLLSKRRFKKDCCCWAAEKTHQILTRATVTSEEIDTRLSIFSDVLGATSSWL